MRFVRLPGFALGTLMVALAACSHPDGTPSGADRAQDGRMAVSVAAPLEMSSTAYEAAAHASLPQAEPENHADLHNVFHLSDQIVSGSEPDGEQAIARIAAMGVRTILSVDGKTPDADTAAKYGMRYVHVPIQYRGISPDELMRIAKTFRELEGPFYVHCFHGKHRGPTAAAVGRLVLDGAARDRAIGEMRQYCGTSASYEGLYRTVAVGAIPTAEETGRYSWSFPAAHQFGGFRQVMVETPRIFDPLKEMSRFGWKPPEDHPDLSPANEAGRLADVFAQAAKLEEVQDRPADFIQGLHEASERARALRAALERLEAGGDGADAAARIALDRVGQSCTDCHKVYRN